MGTEKGQLPVFNHIDAKKVGDDGCKEVTTVWRIDRAGYEIFTLYQMMSRGGERRTGYGT